MGGLILKANAEYFAKTLGHNTFSDSYGWFDKFKNETILRFDMFVMKVFLEKKAANVH